MGGDAAGIGDGFVDDAVGGADESKRWVLESTVEMEENDRGFQPVRNSRNRNRRRNRFDPYANQDPPMDIEMEEVKHDDVLKIETEKIEDEIDNKIEDEIDNKIEDEIDNKIEDEIDNKIEDEIDNKIEDE
eukprot:Trichotokara_eunicae@DN2446_c0_g1_i2.p1